ncbi:13438_t:CDS:2, partial [Funneliformis caledonium]
KVNSTDEITSIISSDQILSPQELGNIYELKCIEKFKQLGYEAYGIRTGYNNESFMFITTGDGGIDFYGLHGDFNFIGQ